MDVFLFAARVDTEVKALDYAFELGLVRKDAPVCPLCHNVMKWERGIKRRGIDGIWRCRNGAHKRTSSSLFAGSIFQHFYVTVSSFLKVLYCIAQGFTVDETTANAKLSRVTVMKIHQKVREMMMQYNRIYKKNASEELGLSSRSTNVIFIRGSMALGESSQASFGGFLVGFAGRRAKCLLSLSRTATRTPCPKPSLKTSRAAR